MPGEGICPTPMAFVSVVVYLGIRTFPPRYITPGHIPIRTIHPPFLLGVGHFPFYHRHSPIYILQYKAIYRYRVQN